MSILLESLNQDNQSSNKNQSSEVPGVGDSHYDDEMFSDEWLLEKLKFWKIISGILVTALIISWVGFYSYSSRNIDIEVDSIVVSKDILLQEKQTVIDESKVMAFPVSKSQQAEIGQIENEQTENEQTKARYQPKKIEKVVSSTPSQSQSKKKSAFKNTTKKIMDSNKPPVEFESLSESEKTEFPELDISSYALSSNVDKSFVVLNGVFYGQGETIAPHLILVSIDKSGILIRYKGQLIRKKYDL